MKQSGAFSTARQSQYYPGESASSNVCAICARHRWDIPAARVPVKDEQRRQRICSSTHFGGASRRNTFHCAGYDGTVGHFSRRQATFDHCVDTARHHAGAAIDAAEQRLRDELLVELDHHRTDIDTIRRDVAQLLWNMHGARGAKICSKKTLTFSRGGCCRFFD